MTGLTPIDGPSGNSIPRKSYVPNTPSPTNAPYGPVVVNLADVQPEPVRWAWPGRFALGKLTLLTGDPGLGKSFMTLDMAARVSAGIPWPDAPDVENKAGGVVLLSAEDDTADTIVPRLNAAGADLQRVNQLRGVWLRPKFGGVAPPDPVEGVFDLTRDMANLEKTIKETPDCRLVVIDPIAAYLGGTDSHKNAELRGLLAPLTSLAGKHRVAVVAVSHLNKNTGGPAIYRSMGSLAFVAAARAGWVVTKDKDDPQRRLVLPVKNNLAADARGMAYTIKKTEPGGAAVVAWEPDLVNMSADDALGSDRGDGGGGALDEATQWLGDMLSCGPVPAKDVKDAAERDGIKGRTLDRAKATLDVVAQREGGFGAAGCWVWGLPHSAPTPPIEHHSQGMAHKGESGALCDDKLQHPSELFDDADLPSSEPSPRYRSY
jgi:hypothetical protein